LTSKLIKILCSSTWWSSSVAGRTSDEAWRIACSLDIGDGVVYREQASNKDEDRSPMQYSRLSDTVCNCYIHRANLTPVILYMYSRYSSTGTVDIRLFAPLR
jgi:hypothetical protein